ncbi:beta-lactamase family protein [Bacillus sp. FJAT-29790]|uniref:serine hydrolase domain-containing protein n=1 Tax=Bacillus sp. FJAT-29790 TaxID=1895002 RepID=UPI001C213AA6|nr:serine hydrolase [Bacillus sp. FJAT-29790]MBU8878803.1 beta-lactamase family protein [Bacillus sp. FJAT-29790]
MIKKTTKLLLFFLIISLIFSVLLVFVSSLLFSPQYVVRTIVNGDSDVTDYKVFPERIIQKSSQPYYYKYGLDESLKTMPIDYMFSGKSRNKPLDTFLKETNTTSFIIVHDDKVVLEEYYNGYDKDTVNTSFSMAKSIDSLLIGMAIEDGYIKSVKQSIADYIIEFKGTSMEGVTIEDLLLMRSNISYEEGNIWFGDDAKTYYMPDLRNLALTHNKLTTKYQKRFHYNNYHPLLLGIILERSTGKHVSEYFEQKVWDKIGAENNASWSLDSKVTGFEKMESGINFKAIDFVKIGSMLLNGGTWNGQHIVNENWLKQSLFSDFPINSDEYKGSFLENKNIGYKYMWYSTPNNNGGLDYFAIGKYGQYLYMSPENNIVILRTGKSMGNVDSWPAIFNEISIKVGKE